MPRRRNARRETPQPEGKGSRQVARRSRAARAFVLDVADTLEGPKVIEVNNFNSAGLYACDVGKIVDAVEAMEF